MKKILILILLNLIYLTTFSQEIDTTKKMEFSRISIDPPEVINFKQKQIEDSISLTKFSLKRIYRKLFYKKMGFMEDEEKYHLFNTDNINYDSTINFNDEKFSYLNYNQIQKSNSKKSPDTLKTFLGNTREAEIYPPDFHNATGYNHIVEVSNGNIMIFDKSGSVLSKLTKNQFFSSDSTKIRAFGDPRIYFDQQKNQWVSSIMAFSYKNDIVNDNNFRSRLIIMISQTNDPTGNWYRYNILSCGILPETSDSLDFQDYPQIGFNKKWLVITALGVSSWKNFREGLTIFDVPTTFIFNKDSLYSGLAPNYTLRFDINGYPSICNDTISEKIYFIRRGAIGPSSFGIEELIGTPSAPQKNQNSKYFFSPLYFEGNSGIGYQKNDTSKISLNDGRIQNIVDINNHLWFAFDAYGLTDKTKNKIIWFQIEKDTYIIKQCGYIIEEIDSLESDVRYGFPQIAVNKNNDAIIVFARTSKTSYPSISYSYRSATDSINTFREPFTYKWGVYAQRLNIGRWGDYFGASVDPVDSSFWLSGQINDSIPNDNRNIKWQSIIAHVDRVDPCTNPSNLNYTELNPTSIYLTWSSSSNDTAYLVSYNKKGTIIWNSDTVYSAYDTIFNLSPNLEYTFTIQSFCPDGLSSPSTLNFKPTPPICNDIYELNELMSTSKSVYTNTDIFATIGKKKDYDFYKFKTDRPKTNLNIVLSDLSEDYDMILYNSNGNVLSSSSNSNTSNENIIYNTNNSNNYYILVKSKDPNVFDSKNCYKLKVNTVQ